MRFNIQHQESYSRLELILRTLFGFIYIVIPHAFILMFVGLWGAILTFLSFWSILFTGKYPRSFFEFQIKNFRWQTRVRARILNLADDYPAFGLNGKDEHSEVEIPYPEKLSPLLAIVKVLFGGLYVGLPHGFVLIFRFIWCFILLFLAWWSVLFTGKFPKAWHKFVVDTLRWAMRVNIYLYFMTDDYPPFSGRPDADDDRPAGMVPETEKGPEPNSPTSPEEHPHLSSPDLQAEIISTPKPPPGPDSDGNEKTDSDDTNTGSKGSSDDPNQSEEEKEE